MEIHMTVQDQIKRLEEIQKAIFTLAEKADREIVSFGSVLQVKNFLVNIQKESMNIFEIISDLETPKTPEPNVFFNEKTPDPVTGGWDKETPSGECALGMVAVETFFQGCVKIYTDHMNKDFPTLPLDEFRMTSGKRYIKVIRGGSAHCFVDRTNGDVLKAASWSAPAKHARGNIWKDDNGLGCIGEYGASYLRG